MKKCIFIIGIGISLIYLASCRKENSSVTLPTTSESVLDYFPLNAGNYWVYKQTQYDNAGNLMPQTWENDSVVVKNDTIINNKTYHKVVEYNFLGATTQNTYFYRDSANCIISNYGDVIFSINSGIVYNKVFSPDTVAYVNYSFINTTTSVIVPLGTYNCVDFKGEVFRKADNYSIPYLTHNYYNNSIGPVKKDKMFVNALYRIYFDLINYHLQ